MSNLLGIIFHHCSLSCWVNHSMTRSINFNPKCMSCVKDGRASSFLRQPGKSSVTRVQLWNLVRDSEISLPLLCPQAAQSHFRLCYWNCTDYAWLLLLLQLFLADFFSGLLNSRCHLGKKRSRKYFLYVFNIPLQRGVSHLIWKR